MPNENPLMPSWWSGADLMTAQARILEVLVEMNEVGQYPNRIGLNDRIGLTASETLSHALYGAEEYKGKVRKGGYSGLIQLGLCEQETLDIDGRKEIVYSITDAGRKAFSEYIAFWDSPRLKKLPGKKSTRRIVSVPLDVKVD